MNRAILFVVLAGAAMAGDTAGIQLPTPQKTGGMPLMQALQARQSGREFSAEKLSPQMLSNLLWAAYGVNRPDGRRTAPSANNRQTVDIFAALPEGIYLFDAKEHRLQLVAAGDQRAATGTQPFAAEAVVDLVYVADYSRAGNSSDMDKALYSGSETGSIAQNVYLFCASEGLATVVRASVNREALSKALKLRAEQKIMLAQSVGYPKRAQ